MYTLCSPSHLFSALFIQSSRPLFIFALEITGQDTKGFLGWEEMAEGWCNGLIKDFKLRLEKSRMLLCGENHRIHRTTPFLMTQAWSKPLEHYIPTNMPLPDQPLLISGWCSQPHVKRDDRFYLHMRNDEESRLLMRAESLFLVRYWHATCESIRLCSLLSDLSVVWLSWLKDLWWQGKIQYEGESVFFSVCTFT